MDLEKLQGHERHVADKLLAALGAAVAIHILDLRSLSERERAHLARTCDEVTSVIAAHGDDLIYGGTQCKATFSALARGLAIAAFQPGGITFLGQHWCTDHSVCRAADAAVANGEVTVEQDETLTSRRRRPRRRRPVVTVELPDWPGEVTA